MKISKTVNRILLCAFAAVSFSSSAEDIELYVNHNVDLDEKPRVLIVFDTSGSMAFSTSTGNSCGYSNYSGYILCSDRRLCVAQSAITSLVEGNDDLDFGLMSFNSTDGGYVLSGIGSSSSFLKHTIAALPANGGTPLTETLWEAYLYITGQNVFYGEKVNEVLRDTSLETRNQTGNWWNPQSDYTYISQFDNSE